MSKPLGETFGDEVIAANLGGLPFSWGATDDDILGRTNLTEAQNVALDDVIAAHDHTKQSPPDVAPETEALYVHENRIRALEGVPPLSLEEVLDKIKKKQL